MTIRFQTKLSLVLTTGTLIMILAQCGCRRNQWESSLVEATSGADRIQISWTDDYPTGASIEVRDPARIKALFNSTKIDAGKSGGFCKCLGDITFRVYQGKTLLVRLGYAHGDRLKWYEGRWSGDAMLTSVSQKAVRRWLEDVGWKFKSGSKTGGNDEG